jgi:hypothetical protein
MMFLKIFPSFGAIALRVESERQTRFLVGGVSHFSDSRDLGRHPDTSQHPLVPAPGEWTF